MQATALQQAFEQAQQDREERTIQQEVKEATVSFSGLSPAKREGLKQGLLEQAYNIKSKLADIVSRAHAIHPHLLESAPVNPETGHVDREHVPPKGYETVFRSLAREWEANFNELRRVRSTLEALQ